jgi:cell filamentation protein
VSGDAERLAEKKARENREANLVANRIRELHLSPVAGVFDLAHLKAVHAHLFQDLPEHRPGVVRADSDGWNKARSLEGSGPSHVVRYAHEGVEAKLDTILKNFGGPDALHGLSLHDAAKRLARLYGDLDHAHGFYEGNSRTLREVTRELAEAAGYVLDWTRSGVGTNARNALYVARDVEVFERAYPSLTDERAMATEDRAEYEAWWHLEKLKAIRGENTLEQIIARSLSSASR